MSYYVNSAECASLLAAVLNALNSYDYITAQFYVERLKSFAAAARLKDGSNEAKNTSVNEIDVSEESIANIVATTYYRSGKANRALMVLKQCKSADNRYLAALCCFEMNDFSGAEEFLLASDENDINNVNSKRTKLSPSSNNSNVPRGAFGYHLLGKICMRTNRLEKAVKYFRNALKLDSCHWASYEALCDLGFGSNLKHYFKSDADSLKISITDYQLQPPPPQQSQQQQQQPPPSLQQRQDSNINTNVTTDLTENLDQSLQMTTPYTTPFQSNVNDKSPPKIVNRKEMKTQRDLQTIESKRLFNDETIDESFEQTVPKVISEMETPDIESTPDQQQVPIRRSARLQKRQGKTGVRRPPKAPLPAIVPFPIMETPAGPSSMTRRSDVELNKNKQNVTISNDKIIKSTSKFISISNEEKISSLLKTLRSLGKAYYLLSQYRCREAAVLLNSLPSHHKESGWVLAQLGRCYFEMVDYPRCIATYKLLRQIEPHRMSGLEYFSTALWHLKQEVDLSYLAQQMVSFDKLCPETWIVVGNCFSLQKEHDSALKFFTRAIQLDPYFAYAFTLCGHEFVANEDFDKAISGYRAGLQVNERHYNAWYGLGSIYYRQEKLELAQYHFQRALKINNRSSVLLCYLGMVLHAKRELDPALKMLTKAEQLDENNAMIRYHKAQVFVSMDRLSDAVEELKKVNEFAPKEAAVHFLLGRTYKKLDEPEKALQHLSIALELNPKDRNQIKSQMDRLYTTMDDGSDGSDESL